jgi:hypothetical protein
MRDINIKTTPLREMRYPTIGDYWETPFAVEVRVAHLPDRRMEQLVIIHELVEIFLMQHRNIRLADSDDFDIVFEAERDAGQHGPDDEPGDDVRCPYRREHRFAENIERLLCQELGLDFDDYAAQVMKVWNARLTANTTTGTSSKPTSDTPCSNPLNPGEKTCCGAASPKAGSTASADPGGTP